VQQKVLPKTYFEFCKSIGYANVMLWFFVVQTLQYELCINVKERKQTNPIIGRLDTKAGHGAGRPTQKLVCATNFTRSGICPAHNLELTLVKLFFFLLFTLRLMRQVISMHS
jgi:hypothetical protein